MNEKEFSINWKGDGYYLVRTKSNGSGIFKVLMFSNDIIWMENKDIAFLSNINDIKEIEPIQIEKIR